MRTPSLTLIIIALAMLMESLDGTALNTAIPAMAMNLSVNPVDLKLALISYLLSLAIFIPISGWIADKYGVKKVFIFAISTFTLSSIACATTESLWGLVCARAVQGLGGSMMLPIGRLIIIKTSERHEILNKMTVVIMIASLGMLLGPWVGGLITYYLSWRWIFWVNAPIGLCVLFLALKGIPALPPLKPHRLDKIGFVLFSGGLSLLTLGLSLISESTLTWHTSISMITVACILLIGYYFWSKRQRHPIVKTALFQNRTFSIAVISNLICRLSFGGVPFLLPLIFQIGLQLEPQRSGLLIAPIAIGIFAIKPMAHPILRRFGYKKVLMFNTLCIAASIASFGLISPTTPQYTIGVLTFLYGVLIALQFTAMNSLAYAEIETQHQSSATSIMSTIQQLAISFGVATAAILIRYIEYLYKTPTLSLEILQRTFSCLGLMTCFCWFVFLKLKKGDGETLIRKP